MTRTSWSATCLVLVAIVVSACSSGATKHSPFTTTTNLGVPTTILGGSSGYPPIASTEIKPTGVGGRCPTRYLSSSFGQLDVGAHGLNKTLVPIIATAARICVYEVFGPMPLNYLAVGPHRVLHASTTTRFEAATNRLPKADRLASCRGESPFFFVLFANERQRVAVWTSNGCGVMTNGSTAVATTEQWNKELNLDLMP
jgi:hypothetical protein